MDKAYMLDEAIREGFEELKTKELGSEEYSNGAKALATLYETDIKIATEECEENNREDRLEIEKKRLEMDQKQAEEDRKWYHHIPWGSIVSGGFMLVGLGLTEKWQADGKLIKIGNLLPKPKL